MITDTRKQQLRKRLIIAKLTMYLLEDMNQQVTEGDYALADADTITTNEEEQEYLLRDDVNEYCTNEANRILIGVILEGVDI